MMSSVYVRKPSEERDNKNTKEKEKTLEEQISKVMEETYKHLHSTITVSLSVAKRPKFLSTHITERN